MFLNMNALCKRPLPAILLILLIGIIVYANTFQAPFTFDDDLSIIGNAVIRNLDNYYANSTGFEHYPHRVVAYVTFALNYHFGGLDVTGYHLVNLFIHLAAAVLVYALLRMTFRTPYFQVPGPKANNSTLISQPSTGARSAPLQPSSFIPLFAALLFVAHPVQTQAVTYVVQRLTSLATMFYLLSVVLYIKARLRVEQNTEYRIQNTEVRAPSTLNPQPASMVLAFFAGSVISAILAMKTKEIAFTLPLAVVLYEVFFFRGDWKRRLFCLLPLLATLPIIPVSVFLTGDSAGDVLSDISEKSRADVSMSRSDYLFTQFRVIVTYLRLLVLPVNQNLDYDYPIYTSFFTPPVFLSFLLLAALFALAVYLFFASRPPSSLIPRPSSGAASGAPTQPSILNDPAFRLIAFGILWFFLTLSVESSLIPIVDVIFEHRLYLPSVGAAAAFAAAFFLAAERFFRKIDERWIAAVALLIVAGLSLATLQRNHVWGSELRLWQDTAAKSPLKGRPLNNFAVALEDKGRRREAIEVLLRAIEVEPTYHRSWYNLGDLYIVSGRPEEALAPLQAAIELKPDFTEAYVKLGAALIRGRQFREAAIFLEQNLDRVATHGEARFYLGAAHAFLGNREAALRELGVVSQLDPALARDLAGLLRRSSGHGAPHGQ
jgi:protein O-mannosyl-transferase